MEAGDPGSTTTPETHPITTDKYYSIVSGGRRDLPHRLRLRLAPLLVQSVEEIR